MRRYNYHDSSTFAIRATSKTIERAMEIELKRRVGLSFAQSRVIGALALIKNGLTQTDLAEKLAIEAPTLVPIIDKLEALGLVQRKPDPTDRRRNIILLTANSESTWDLIVDCANKIQQISQNGIDRGDIRILLSVVRKMNNNVLAYVSEEHTLKNVRIQMRRVRSTKSNSAELLQADNTRLVSARRMT